MSLDDGGYVLIVPPKPPGDVIESALFLHLADVQVELHRGRKIRTVGQILAYDIKSSSALLAAPSKFDGRQARKTLLVDLSVPLLGLSPAAKDVSSASGAVAPHVKTSNQNQPAAAYEYRGRVKLESGEWISVVGWLGTELDHDLSRVHAGDGLACPLPVKLEAIHLSNAREPPPEALHRGSVPCWDGCTSNSVS